MMRLPFPMSPLVLMIAVVFSYGCIEKSSSGADGNDGDQMQNVADSTTGSGATGTNDADTVQLSDAGGPSAPSGSDGAASPGQQGEDDMGGGPIETRENPCNLFCEQVEGCLLVECPGLEAVVPPNFCRGWCRDFDEDTLLDYAEAECSEFLDKIYDDDEDLASFCSDEPVPDECIEICEAADRCGFEEEGCRPVCRDLSEEQRQCMLGAEGCEELFACVDGGRGEERPDPEDLCEPYCSRRSQCLFDECSAGTLPEGYTRGCIEECFEDPPSFEEFRTFFDLRCEQAVESILEQDPELNARCNASPEDSCETLCDERVVPCMGISQAACVADCQNWDRANQICVVTSRRCRDVNACFGDPEGQVLCRRNCDHLQACLEEACPPRSIPPTVTDGCTAGCLNDPPTEAETEDWEALSCRQVREFVYQGNRELRPICEGGRDFRPTPEECVAFCDNALGQCLGVGGRNFCLAGCASLTRDQYGCALEAQGNCEVIDQCLAQD